MLAHLRRSFVASVIFFAILGLAYPLVETGLGQVFFYRQANGSLTKYGSTLVAQKWVGPKWFQSRPGSDTEIATGGTNLGPRSEMLVKDVSRQIARLKSEGISPTPDLVTTSGSGIDPDISPNSAYAQVSTIANARGISPTRIRRLVTTHIVPRELGFLGSPYVNVLTLNETLAKLK